MSAIPQDLIRSAFRRLPLRVPTLGWLRVVLALLVMQFHYGFDAVLTVRMLEHHPSWAPHLQYMGSGNMAVVGFFVISGYLVSSVVAKRYDASRVADFIHFTVSRYLRIFPLYVVLFVVFCLVAAFVVHVPVAPDASTLFSRLLLLPTAIGQIWPQSFHPLFMEMVPAVWGAVWTLPFDILFYPLGFLLLRDRRAVAILLPIMLVAQIALGILYAAPSVTIVNPFDNAWDQHAYATLSFCLTAFTAGMAGHLWLRAWKHPLVWAAMSAGALLVLMFFPWDIPAGIAAVLAIALMTMLVHALAQKGSDPQEANMGHYTYAVYLMHQFLGSVPLTLLAGYWIGVKFEGGPIARARKWAESATDRALARSKRLVSMQISPWLAVIVFVIAAINLSYLFHLSLALR
jgi:peptidoglycan/LPS O-acetylase OafA/YrhL